MGTVPRAIPAWMLLIPAFCAVAATWPAAAWPAPASGARNPSPALADKGPAAAVDVQFVVDNQVWQPGERYITGSDWLALTCTEQGCALEPATLAVEPESWQGHYDEHPTQGQKLTFQEAVPSQGEVVAWLRTTGAPPWLKPGAVPTYHSTAMPRNRPPTPGTLETLVELPSGKSATLVPMLREKSGDQDWSVFLLQLRSGNRRQFLAGELGRCSKMVTTSYLLWAGDLDRDGEPDYLVSFVDEDGPVHLYLSGRADEEWLVGLGGTYDAPPFGGECDGGGWVM